MGLSNKLSCEAGSFSHHLNPHRFFSARGFEDFFPCIGTLGCVVCLTPQLFLLVYLHANMGPSAPPATALTTLPAATLPSPPAAWSTSRCFACPSLPTAASLQVLSTRLPMYAPPTGLDECFLFNSLVVGHPNSLILWQFWLF